MLSVEPFRPWLNGTVSISANGTASGTASLGTSSLPGNISCRIHNAGPALGFVVFGGDATLAANTTSCFPVPVGAIEIINIDQSQYAAAICAAGTTATIYFTKGYGI